VAEPLRNQFPRPLPAELVERVAERFHVIGEPMRIRLLDALYDGDATVSALQEATGASQQNVSRHLGVLLRAGVVSRRKQGNHSVYSIADPSVYAICDEVCAGLLRQLDELEGLLKGSR
jgi:DNA-binding transcriptional ArsR family regulator